MFRNFFKTAFRNLIKSKGYSIINIGGLAVGMSTAILIGLWIWDELSFNKYHENYGKIAQVMQHQTFNGQISTQVANPAVMGEEIRNRYGRYFKYVLQSSWNFNHTLAYGGKKLLKEGSFFEPGVTEMLSLKMLKGTRAGLAEPYSILLSESVAKACFGDTDPIDKVIKVDNNVDVKVTGVYQDLPYNAGFRNLTLIMPWKLYLILNPWVGQMNDPWGSNFSQTFAQIADNADMETVSAAIKNVKLDRVDPESKKYNAQVFLHPMSKWHLFSDFKNGINTGGRVQYAWLFGIVGIFVLLLACINFMNLSTARSEKRAREVGVRKAIGSARRQLIVQFFAESFMVVFFSFLLSILLVILILPFFNEMADKKLSLLWANSVFWILGIGVSVATGFIAGSYPALYLSSFKPVQVLKGTFRAGNLASIPRKVLVVIQFSVSVILIIGTIVVYQQIQHAKNRPIGYNRESLVYVSLTPAIHSKYDALRNELKSNSIVVEMAESISPPTDIWNTNGDFNWEGKDPNLAVDFPNNGVSHEYGKVIGWEIMEGRDFSREFATDSAAFILNESAVKFLGWKEPVGKTLVWEDMPFKIIGVVKDLIVESPYQPVRAALFHLATMNTGLTTVQMRINPNLAPAKGISALDRIFRKYDPASVFEFRFVDEAFARKFGEEERIGKLASCFAGLAIFISCLGLFGLASFVAEQRTKEIGIRKVLGASIANVWQLLSKQFVLLVLISLLIALPLAYYFMNNWLENYPYRATLYWWIFAGAGLSALLIALLTVSFQAIKAALANPIKSLRTE
jgi:putative ABC transport system permease protein